MDRLQRLKGGLVASCQAYPGEPLRDPGMMTAMAQSAVLGGAVAIRAQGTADVRQISQALDVPVIGLLKTDHDGVYITPRVSDGVAVARAGAEIVALDGTSRPRPDGESLAECIEAIHAEGALALADCGSEQDAVTSLEAGADALATTLAGYTNDRPLTDGPDFALVETLAREAPVPVLAEGRIRTPGDAARCLDLGAHAVVVGSSISHPITITSRFVRGMER